MNSIRLALLLSFTALSAAAQVTVKDPWIRATVPQQTATGAFMQLFSPVDARLVSVSSPVAGVVELHEMKMENDVMKMRQVHGIDIPAGKGAELKPGGYHVMLMNLKGQVKEGDVVPIILVVEGKDSKRQTLEVNATARPLTTPAGGGHGAVPAGSDAAAIQVLMMAQFDKPGARLAVAPVVIRGDHAVAGWIQAERGGRALLRRDHGKWKLVACAGDAFKDATELERTGIARARARVLAQEVVAAEKKLPADQVRKLSLFEGMVRMDDSGAHPPHGHGRHGGKAH